MPSCPTHPETSATSTCHTCNKAFCDACFTHEVDGRDACTTCGNRQAEEAHGLGLGLVGLVAVGYLVTLAIGVLVFRGRPFVGGFSAIVAIVLGRTLQLHVHVPVVTLRR